MPNFSFKYTIKYISAFAYVISKQVVPLGFVGGAFNQVRLKNKGGLKTKGAYDRIISQHRTTWKLQLKEKRWVENNDSSKAYLNILFNKIRSDLIKRMPSRI